MGVRGAPRGAVVEAVSNGERIVLRRSEAGIGIRMPEGEGFGLKAVPLECQVPAGFGWIGNPQLVLRVPSVSMVDLSAVAPPFRHHAAVPGGTNVNVVEVLEPGLARIRSWERGVEGETLCCGTGCAVAGAWLARTEGISAWQFQTAGKDPVSVSVTLEATGAWRDLWLTGLVRNLGVVRLDPRFLECGVP